MTKLRMSSFAFFTLSICSIFIAIFIFCSLREAVAAQISPSYEITVTSGENGLITPATRLFKKGKNAVFTIKPSNGYKIAMITVDGEAVDLSRMKKLWDPHKYVFKKISAAHTLSAAFVPDIKISPPIALLKIGDEQVFSFKNSRGKKLNNVTLILEDQSIATVTNGNTVTAKAEGTINGFATYEGMIIEDVTPVIVDPLTIKVVAPPERPAELIEIYPSENETISFIHCDRKDPEVVCPGMPEPGAIGAIFRFEGNDVLDSAQLFLDGADVTSDSSVTNSTYTHVDSTTTTDSSIAYGISDKTLSDGIHEITVSGTSKAGKAVTYTWSFAKK